MKNYKISLLISNLIALILCIISISGIVVDEGEVKMFLFSCIFIFASNILYMLIVELENQ